MTPIERRASALEQIKQCVCVDRCKTHGEAEVNLAHLADVWRWWIKARYGIDVPLDSLDSSQMMSLSKVSRKACNPYVVDHWADDSGYDVIGAGIVMKHLETVKDAQSLSSELNGIASAEPHTEEELKRGMEKLISDLEKPTIDHGEEELKRSGRVMRCGAVDSSRNQCVLNDGHNTDHSFEAYYTPIQ